MLFWQTTIINFSYRSLIASRVAILALASGILSLLSFFFFFFRQFHAIADANQATFNWQSTMTMAKELRKRFALAV